MLGNAVKIVISKPLNKDNKRPKISGRRILIKNTQYFQFEVLRDNKAFHENIPIPDLLAYFNAKMRQYKQADIWNENGEHSVIFSDKGELRPHKTKNRNSSQVTIESHDRNKNYILKEGEDIPILCELGVFNTNNNVIKGMHSKFKQVNKFVQIIDTSLKDTKTTGSLNIVDFGCGSSHLTFVVYHYFTQIKKIPVNITGVDLQTELITKCNELAAKYDYKNLSFVCSDIKAYSPALGSTPDMIISLHGCNTATDYAISKGIKWGVEYMFIAPCCQHEINTQMKRDDLGEIYAPLRYGVLKDRFASLLTDGLRANIIEMHDYKVDIVEFVGFNHSPKNILIRAVKSAHRPEYKQKLKQQTSKLIEDFNINPTLMELTKFS
ncbi:MAG: SAM-dependent methyltransferase [Oscillospiraceae bacterium]|jgi:SAM-dependent methyltransferase|nr:SAM-dependent methyltransferase [Oscillospiraceae bacterium]